MLDGDTVGTAGVRRPDGELVFVDGVPATARVGDAACFLGADGEERGIVTIPPALLVWCCPNSARPACISMEPPVLQGDTRAGAAMADLRSIGPYPGDEVLATMLRLAWEEMDKLDGF